MKKIISLFITVCMLLSILSAFPIPVSAFFFDWIEGLLPGSGSSNEPGWFSSGDVVKNDDGSVTLTSPKGGDAAVSASYWYKTDISEDFFDVEWDMTLLKVAGNENIQIRTGSKRVYFVPTTTGIRVKDGNYYPCNIGLGESHHYRAIWKDDIGRIYFDGKFLGLFTMTEIAMEKGFGFWITGLNGDSQMMINNAKLNEQSASANIPDLEKANYHEEFYSFGAENDPYWFANNQQLITWKDGVLQVSNLNQGSVSVGSWFSTTPEYDFTMRCRFNSIGDNGNLVISSNQKKVTVSLLHQGLRVNGKDAKPMDLVDGKWHILRIKTYNLGDSVAVYLDDNICYVGTTVADGITQDLARWSLDVTSNFTTAKDPWDIQVDWIDCIGKESAKQSRLLGINDGAVYQQGDTIVLKASVAGSDGSEVVKFLANGNVIATASAPDFQTEVSDLLPGKYKLYPMIGDLAGASVDITIKAKVDGNLQITPDGNGLKLQTVLTDPLQTVKEVEYRIDGVVAGISSASNDNYTINVPEISPAAHTITAFLRAKNGRKLGQESKQYMVDVQQKNSSIHYMNEIRYRVTGSEGSATVVLSNGKHKVQLTHSKEQIQYLTDAEEKTLQNGLGDFCILTDGATADVYQNGQLAFSYYLPRTEDVKKTVEENGLQVENFTVSIPENTRNYVVMDDVGATQQVIPLGEIPYYHVTDFIADQDDEFRLILEDGHYRTDVEFENGKIYAIKTLKDKTNPYREAVASVLNGKVYYRVEVAAGMVRIYGNGRWLTTFRGEHAEGDCFSAVRVKEGSHLDYINVHDNTDLFFYEDDFNATDSIDFWMTKNASASVENEKLVLDALESQEAITELGAYAGSFDFSADVMVEEGNGGFYLIFNHTVTNGYSKIGYSFVNEQYELVDRNEDVYTTRKTASGQFPIGTKVPVRLKVVDQPTGKVAVLSVNGQDVLSCNADEVLPYRGRVGFVLDDAKALVSQVSYRGDAKVNISMTETINAGTTTDTIEIDDKIILTGSGNRRYTQNGGKTWHTESKPANESNNLIQLRDKEGNLTGSIISVYRKKVGTNELGLDEYAFFVARSDDNGKTYTEISRMQPDGNSNRIVMNNRVTQGPSGRLYFASCENQSESYGAARIYYSDDGGYHWTASETDLRYQDTGFVVAETVAIELGNGIVRCFVRNDLGFISYFNSYDKGKTWDLTPYPTPFLAATNCYNIEVDPYNPNYIYVAWGYDNANLHATVQVPRTRFGVAMSRDAGETWEYVGTVHENNSVINNMMNLNINVTKDYLVVGQCFSTDIQGVTVSNASQSRDILIPKDKIKTTKDFEQVHMRWEWMQNTETMPKELKHSLLAASPASGTVLLHGELLTDSCYGNMISLDCVASYLGMQTETKADGSVVLSVENQMVSIPANILTQKEEKIYIHMEEFAKLFDLACVDFHGVKLFDQFGVWTETNSYVARAMVDLFYQDDDKNIAPIGDTLEKLMDGYLFCGEESYSTLPTNQTAVRAPENGMELVDDPYLEQNKFLRLKGSDTPIQYTNSVGETKTASGGGEYAFSRLTNAPEGGMVRARMRLVSGTGFKFEFRGAGSGYRVEFQVGEDAVMWDYGKRITLLQTMAKGNGEWFEVLAYHTQDKIKYYWLNTDGTYSYLGEDITILKDTSAQIVFIPDLDSTLEVDYVQSYQKIWQKTEQQLLYGRTLVGDVDFTNQDASTYGVFDDGRYVNAVNNYQYGTGHAYGSKIISGNGLLTMKVPERQMGTAEDIAADVPYRDGYVYPFARLTANSNEVKALVSRFTENKIFNFKFKYYNIGRSRSGGGGSEIQFSNGQKEICMIFGASGLTTRGMSAEGSFDKATHEPDKTYEYLVIWNANHTEDTADDYLEVWRRVEEEPFYNYIGKWYDMNRNSTSQAIRICGNSGNYISYDYFRVYSEKDVIDAIYTIENENLKIIATLTGPDAVAQTGKLIVATFHQDGRLLETKNYDVTDVVELNVSASGVASFKLLWWKDMQTMEPLCQVYEKEIALEETGE